MSSRGDARPHLEEVGGGVARAHCDVENAEVSALREAVEDRLPPRNLLALRSTERGGRGDALKWEGRKEGRKDGDQSERGGERGATGGVVPRAHRDERPRVGRSGRDHHKRGEV